MDTLYAILLPIHNILRWLVLLAGLFAIIRGLTGMQFKRPWESMDAKAGLWYTILLDTQVLAGLILYFFLSPATRLLLQGTPGALSNPPTLFFGIEHVVVMVIALALAHVGRALSRKATERRAKHRTAVIFYSLSLVAILLGIPWPFLPVIGRPLLRL